ncbi:CCA tRNA nucleotidyltransferase [bacterium]|nr:CCA tRNA nucleotidyltransferase [bacterium]
MGLFSRKREIVLPRFSPVPEWMGHDSLKALFAAFAAEGEQLWFVGGCVRDGLLGLPVSDIDMATTVLPDAMMEFLPKHGIKAVGTGVAHGTVTATFGKEHDPVQITTLRQDTACDGRHADVAFGTSVDEDAKRRDFTINAMYATADGEIIDPTGGLHDLEKRMIRFVGNADDRVREDGLRMLRFFRFWSRFGERVPDKMAMRAIKLHHKMVNALSGERIREEMGKLLLTQNAVLALDWMSQVKLWVPIFGMKQLFLQRLVKLQSHPLAPREWILFLTAILPRDKELGEWVGERWKLSRKERNLLAVWQSPLPSPRMGDAELKMLLRAHGRYIVLGQLWLLWADGVLPANRLQYLLEIAQGWEAPVFPLTGKDLQKLGFREGKELGIALKQLETSWEADGYSPDKKALLEMAKKILGKAA